MKVKDFASKISEASEKIPVVIMRGSETIGTSSCLWNLSISNGSDFPGAAKVLDSTINFININHDEIIIQVK